MKKIIIIPDSFKGTLSSREACDIMAKSTRRIFPHADVIPIPIADGGEGTVDAVLSAVGGEKIRVPVKGPLFDEVDACYCFLPDRTAFIEMAAAAGLPLMGGCKAVEAATTYGVGELMRHALENGAQRIVLGLGGSATNDGGCGAAAAMGAVFKDPDGNAFVPTGASLCRIASMNIEKVQASLRGVPVEAMCDIDNPLVGENGAAYIFAPQKGADEHTVRMLDNGLQHLMDTVSHNLGIKIDIPGAGAAGGMGAGVVAFFNGRLIRGIDAMLDLVQFDERLHDADVVFTGEGRLDRQSMMGKAVGGIAQRAKMANIPVICVAGAVSSDIDELYRSGITAAFSINREPLPFSEAARQTRENLARTMDNLLRLLDCRDKKQIVMQKTIPRQR